MERPDGIIITISQGLLKERGVRNWLQDFLEAMSKDSWTYWMRLGSKPKFEVLYVYLVINNRIRYKSKLVCYEDGGEMTFNCGKTLNAKAWVVMCGPVVRAPHTMTMKGFRGFRYTEQLF